MQVINPGGKPTAPIKLRAACNQCHLSKVRCSGEKTGCARCSSLGYSCVYSESRVGKVQGNRARRLRGGSASAQKHPISPSPSSLDMTGDNRGDSSRSGAGSTPSQGLMDGERPTIELEDGLFAELSCVSHGVYSKAPKDIDDCALFGSLDDFQCVETPLDPMLSDVDRVGNPSHLPSAMVLPQPSPPLGPDKSLDLASKTDWSGFYFPSPDNAGVGKLAPYRQLASQRMVDCVALVHNLEQHIHSRLVAADEVMRVNKHCVEPPTISSLPANATSIPKNECPPYNLGIFTWIRRNIFQSSARFFCENCNDAAERPRNSLNG
ncbi:hypothetical protein TrVGV298_000024 [Trichoderma virens]|nr:hypothetical protein TrVGV298_000024 [Trichoderma virens]UKZ72391.1 hypothetical protein TrVFT333_000020 [Trichoderma virens FT-333]